MTISWGALGNYLGHRHPTLTVYVAPARYTHELMERYNRFTIMEFDDPEVNRYMGSLSGRPATEVSTCPDKKVADLGLHLAYTPGGTPYYEEARTVMECEIMSALHLSSDDFRNDTPRKLYANFKAGEITKERPKKMGFLIKERPKADYFLKKYRAKAA